jgi:hypothetical protein
MLFRDVGRDGVEEEEVAFPCWVGRGCVGGNRGTFQEIQKVVFGCAAPEGLGYVSVNEKCLWKRVRRGYIQKPSPRRT